MWFGVCWLLRVVCCLLRVFVFVRGLLFVLSVIGCSWFVFRGWLFAVCCLLSVVCLVVVNCGLLDVRGVLLVDRCLVFLVC